MKTNDDLVAIFNERITMLENDVEELFYTLIAKKSSKKTLEEVVQTAVIQHFNVNIKDFYGKNYIKEGQPISIPESDRAIIDARKWFMSFMRYVLLKTSFHLKLDYPFYANVKEFRHRKEFHGAQHPVTEKDMANRVILLAISKIVKRICKEEGITDDSFDF